MTKRILIIEDQEDNRAIMRDVLSSAGYALIEAVDGEEGVKLARSERPDLIRWTFSCKRSTAMRRPARSGQLTS
jgi:CheY-like chemotaxis protein